MNTIYCGIKREEKGTGANLRATAAGERTRNEETTQQAGNKEKERVCDSRITTKECNSKQANRKMK